MLTSIMQTLGLWVGVFISLRKKGQVRDVISNLVIAVNFLAHPCRLAEMTDCMASSSSFNLVLGAKVLPAPGTAQVLLYNRRRPPSRCFAKDGGVSEFCTGN
jgi:hypothetical protein